MRRPVTVTFLAIAAGAVFFCTTLPLTAGIYYWTDENGVRHYSNVAPSETGDEVQRQDEVPPPAPESRTPANRTRPGPREPASSGVKAPAEAPSAGEDATKEKRPEESGAEPTAESDEGKISVPTEQNEIVRSEKAVVKDLQRQLEEDASQRDKIIEKERRRLERALEQLQKTSVGEFGSQKNKTRAMGYYRLAETVNFSGT